MNFSLILIAFWLYAGRSVLLGLITAIESTHDRVWRITVSIAVGLLIPPILLSIFLWWNLAFEATLVLLICIDLMLLYKLFRTTASCHISIRPVFLLFLIFVLIVFALSLFNGPYIEHLPDSWWHMKNISLMVNHDTLILPSGSKETSNSVNALITHLGIDYSSYRLQAFLTWITDCSILESWIASSAVASAILGASVFLLFYYLRLDYLTLALSLLFWLVLFGGMNTGLRLGGWPAGMGYAFLNIGLAASYQLFCNFKSSNGWILLLVSALGAIFFHLAELFLLTIALAALISARSLFSYLHLSRAIFVLVIFSAVVTTLYASISSSPFAIDQAIVRSALVLSTGWLLGVLYFRIGRTVFYFVSILVVSLVGYIVIDWDHLFALFYPDNHSKTSYYSGYIPHYKSSWDGRFLVISKWGHQLRASILWSGVVGLFLAIWLWWTLKSRLSQWLLVLMCVPWLILISPAIFTLLSSFVPMYGVYRVQFLMPTAVVLGLSASYAGRQLFEHNHPGNTLSAKSRVNAISWLNSYLSNNTAALILLFSAIYIAYFVFIETIDNFIEIDPVPWFEIFLLLACVITCFFRISAKKVLSFSIVSVCSLLLVSDLAVRLGFSNERAWAVQSNIQFHWLLRDNRETIRLHTSWRYKNDLQNIRKLTASDESVGFLSDLATSYYVAAETKLRPLVQQAHHSKFGHRYNEIILAFCNSDISGHELLSKISTIKTRVKKSGTPIIQYIIINRDTINYTAEVFGTSCVGETDHLLSELSSIAEIRFKGDFLSLWKLKE